MDGFRIAGETRLFPKEMLESCYGTRGSRFNLLTLAKPGLRFRVGFFCVLGFRVWGLTPGFRTSCIQKGCSSDLSRENSIVQCSVHVGISQMGRGFRAYPYEL